FINMSYITSIFFTSHPPTEIYTLSLHDALPILGVTDICQDKCNARVPPTAPVRPAVVGEVSSRLLSAAPKPRPPRRPVPPKPARDRKSTRLNSSHLVISYAVFCLKKKK